MRFNKRKLTNTAIVLVLALFFGGVLTIGVLHDQLGETLFNATLV